jgi:hypothetical protein
MRHDPLTATRVLEALERFGPQARPYNFDDMFDCWGLVRRLVDWLDDGDEVNDELGDDERSARVTRWAPLESRDELVPGDVLTSHPHASRDFHVVVFCGRVGEVDLVFDSSPRGGVPLFDSAGRLTDARPLFARFMRATETTDRLRHDGGGWLRLYDERMRFFNKALHARLLAADPGRERDLVTLRRAAGLSDLPDYCTARLARDARGREVYDNRWSRHLDYYVPDGGPAWDKAVGTAVPPGRPPAPEIVGVAHRIVREGDWVVEWRPGSGAAQPVEGWRVEVWEETADLWKHRLLRFDVGADRHRFAVPADVLREDARFAVVVWARGAGGFSGDALATALWRPRDGNELLGYNANRPRELRPDGLVAVAASGAGLDLSWSIADPASTQVAARVRVVEDACLADDVAPVFDLTLEGRAAAACRCTLPAGVLHPGRAYAWYVDVRDALGRWCYAPSEGVFVVEEHQ